MISLYDSFLSYFSMVMVGQGTGDKLKRKDFEEEETMVREIPSWFKTYFNFLNFQKNPHDI